MANRDEVETLARELHCRLYRTSVKEDLNVSQVFQYLAEKYLSQLDALDDFCDEPPRSITIGMKRNNIFAIFYFFLSHADTFLLVIWRPLRNNVDKILYPNKKKVLALFRHLIWGFLCWLTDAFVPHSGNGLNGHQNTKIRRLQRWASRLPRFTDHDTIRLQSNRKKIIITKNKLRNACSF